MARGWPLCDKRVRRGKRYYCTVTQGAPEWIEEEDCWQCYAFSHEEIRTPEPDPLPIPPTESETAWWVTLGLVRG